MAPKEHAFAVWITGLPGSGKSTITRALATELNRRGIAPAVLESDQVRKVLTPVPTYSETERDTFYAALVYIGKLLTEHGVPVIFDATANRRAYRDRAREQIVNFMEVFVDCPLELCMRRDPKGIYAKGSKGLARSVPGLQIPYEPPAAPELTLGGKQIMPEDAARQIIAALAARHWLRPD